MPDFRSALAGDAPRTAAIERLIAKLKERPAYVSARFSQAATNVLLEVNLHNDCWVAMADYMLGPGQTKNLGEIETDLSVLFRSFRLQGPTVPKDRTIYGRAILRDTLVDMFQQEYPAWALTDIWSLVDNLPLLSVAATRSRLGTMELGRYGLMWSTYCETADNPDPFNPRIPPSSHGTTGELIDDLGLDYSEGQVFYLVAYMLPAPVELRIPTIADAYGGYFFPAFRPEGRTNPIRYASWLGGRPERVHAAILGDALAAPVEHLVAASPAVH